MKYKKLNPSISRKVNIGAWKSPGDPAINCKLDIEVTEVLNYLKKLRERTGEKITINHFVAKVIGYGLVTFPELNCILLRNTLYQRMDVNVSFMVNIETEDGFDLIGFLIPDIDRMSLIEVARFIQQSSQSLREGVGKKANNSMKTILDKVPSSVFPWLLRIMNFFQYTLNFNPSRATLPPYQSGGAIVTAVGSLGLEEIYGSLSDLAHCPVTVALGKIRKMPIVVDDKIAIGNVSTITFTYDHRYVDAVHYVKLQTIFKNMFENPENYTDVLFPIHQPL